MISKRIKRIVVEKFNRHILSKDETEITFKLYLLRMMEEFSSFSSIITKIFIHTTEINVLVFEIYFKKLLRYIIYGCELLNIDINNLLDEIEKEDSEK